MENLAKHRLKKLRKLMKEEKIDAYLVLSSDFHNSEYVSGHFKCREFLTGFTGSAGSAAVLQEEAVLWTDGRYFLQAESELAGSGIELYREGEEGVEELEQYLVSHLPKGATLGVDGRTLSVERYRGIKKKLKQKQISIRLDCDLVGSIWKDRPQMPCEPVWGLELSYAGRSRKEKLADIRKQLEEKADMTFISALEDIAWVLNIRGNDVDCTPVALGFLAVDMERAVWFVQPKAVGDALREELLADGVLIKDYWEAYGFFCEKYKGKSVYLDFYKTNTMIYKKAKRFMHVKKGRNLTMLPKATKNETEIRNVKKAHMKDAVACVKFIYWLKTHVLEERITEISAAEKLEGFRQGQEHYIGPSFHTIVGYAQHGAIVHYSATEQTNVALEPKNFVLVDSGGHYLEGTTDITRTIALGELAYEQKYHYTLVLKGHIRLAMAKFKYGCSGMNLDSIARQPLWEQELDFNHGTGHGVGYLLSVHEPPNSFRSRMTKSMEECEKLEPGMITSNEPGIYLTGEYGVRIENLMVSKQIGESCFGKFMGFDTLTLVPYERDAILKEELSEKEREWLNAYHEKVFRTIGPCLDEKERDWLKDVTEKL